MGIVKVAAETLKEAGRRANAPKVIKDFVLKVGKDDVVIRSGSGRM
jgi:hypothetical protein